MLYYITKIALDTEGSSTQLIGAGSESFDIKHNNVVIDSCRVCLGNKNQQTGEKSLCQHFKGDASTLDHRFKNGEYDKAVLDFIDIYKQKLIPYQEYNKYYMIFICTEDRIKLCLLKINLDNINNVNVDTTKLKPNSKSIFIANFINKEYGCVKLYQSKKRLELRLCRGIIENPNVIDIYIRSS